MCNYGTWKISWNTLSGRRGPFLNSLIELSVSSEILLLSWSTCRMRQTDPKSRDLKYVFLAGNIMIGWYTYSKHIRLASPAMLLKLHSVELPAHITRLTLIKRPIKQKKFIVKEKSKPWYSCRNRTCSMPKCRKMICAIYRERHFGGNDSDWSK